MRLKEIIRKLPGLNCGECVSSTCREMAEKIYRGNARLSDCVVITAKKKVSLKINKNEVPMVNFVQDFVKKTVLGMVSSLKKSKLKKGDVVELKIRVDKDDL
ncbi:hypothetical protein HY991_05965 [Candidatus Micrarchaeota archaeon]|nr:hypothetical protein [Candidatus Micrarchaeota archaeon]